MSLRANEKPRQGQSLFKLFFRYTHVLVFKSPLIGPCCRKTKTPRSATPSHGSFLHLLSQIHKMSLAWTMTMTVNVLHRRTVLLVVLLLVACCCITSVQADPIRLYGINYNTRKGPDWAPDDARCKTRPEVVRDLTALRYMTSRIRILSLYDCNQGEIVLSVAKELGLELWLGKPCLSLTCSVSMYCTFSHARSIFHRYLGQRG